MWNKFHVCYVERGLQGTNEIGTKAVFGMKNINEMQRILLSIGKDSDKRYFY